VPGDVETMAEVPAGKQDRVTLYVCTTCRSASEPDPGAGQRPGARLARSIAATLGETGRGGEIDLVEVECLGVCKRPCTISFMAPGKWIYLIGDIDPDAPVEAILDGLRRYAASSDGMVPWRERPEAFRKGLVGRIPPLPEQAGASPAANTESIA
jgi:predicted metal-binding protein